MVRGVRLHLKTSKAQAHMVSTALAFWSASPPPPREASNVERCLGPCRVRLEVASRPARPYERADGLGYVAAAPGLFAHQHVSLALADGTSVLVEAQALACSTFLARLLSRSESDVDCDWTERRTGIVSLIEHPPDVVRGVVRWLQASAGAEKRAVASHLLSPHRIVGVVRLCHFLDLQPAELLDAALSVLASEALEVSNAPSLLLLARELDAAELQARATDFIARRLDQVEAEAEDWSVLPQPTRSLLGALREAIARPLTNGSEASAPISGSGACFGDARELLAMLKESLHQQQERLREARQRQRDLISAEVAALPDALVVHRATRRRCAPPAVAASLADQLLEAQAERVDSFAAYVAEQEEVFVQLLAPPEGRPLAEPDSPATATAGMSSHSSPQRCGVLVPSYEWQSLSDGCAVPPGLQVDLPLDGRSRPRARIPPRWRLRVWVSAAIGFWAHDCDRGTTVRQLYDAAAAELAPDCDQILRLSIDGEAVDAAGEAGRWTVEEARLFERQAQVRLHVERLSGS